LEAILQASVGGLLMGGIYSLIAIGLSLIFGVMRIINFAHGEFLMVGMYLSYWLIVMLGIDPYIAALIVTPVLFVIGYAFQGAALNTMLIREKAREPLSILLYTAGLSLVLQNVALILFGADARSAATNYTGTTYYADPIIISLPRFYAFAISIACTGLVFWLLEKTEIGRAIRATSQDRTTAKLMGINEQKIYCIAFGIGAALVGLSGALLVPFYYVFPTVGGVFGLRSFIIVVLGGVGSIKGAFYGGILIGLVEAVGTQFMSPAYAEILVFAIFVAVLLFKPAGLFGLEKS
jgi:branched-chain amino acid transport system permease protein